SRDRAFAARPRRAPQAGYARERPARRVARRPSHWSKGARAAWRRTISRKPDSTRGNGIGALGSGASDEGPRQREESMLQRNKVLAFATTFLMGTTASVAAQSPNYHFAVSPYMWFTALDGDVGVGRVATNVRMSAADILDVLKFGFMLAGE